MTQFWIIIQEHLNFKASKKLVMQKIFTTTVLTLLFFSTLFSQVGELDPSFAENGILTWNPSGNHENCHGIAVQPDGKIVLAFTYSAPVGNSLDFAVGRINEDGSIDSTFATNGIYHLDNPIGSDLLYHLELLEDGSIMVAGGYAVEEYDQDFALLKLKSDGSPDISFGDNGLVTHKVDTKEDYARDIEFNEHGQIIVSGISYNSGEYEIRQALARFNEDGQIDSTFGNYGTLVWNYGDIYNQNYSLEIGEDGSIFTAGKSAPFGNDRLAVYKILPDGSGLDSTFATNGELLAPFGSIAYGMIIHSNGNILVTGPNYGVNGADLIVLAYNQDGTPNENFGQEGTFLIDAWPNDIGLNLIEQSDGKIIACGESGGSIFAPPARGFFSVRMDENGILDTSWGGDGYVRTETGWMAWASDIAIQADGKVLLTGVSADANNDIQVARYGNFIDADQDGYGVDTDCNDAVFAINPGAEETPYNGLDDDCNSETPDDDLDGDGFVLDDDCDDENADINPDAIEIPGNDVDENCDGFVVGINETELAQQFKVYPNPTNDIVYIEFDTNTPAFDHIQIQDFTGRVVRNIRTNGAENKQEISLADLPQGFWMIVIPTTEGTAVKRIMKQ
jgi:uncharacterized delta-60 repeat protein